MRKINRVLITLVSAILVILFSLTVILPYLI